MDYISVKEAALKFNLSERRIQKLCESERITGSHMVSRHMAYPCKCKNHLMNECQKHLKIKII